MIRKILCAVVAAIFFLHLSAQDQTYRGAWFEVKYPSDFTAQGSMGSGSAEDDQFDSAFFTSPDGEVEFYIFSPQWGGESTDIALWPNEKEGDRQVKRPITRPLPIGQSALKTVATYAAIRRLATKSKIRCGLSGSSIRIGKRTIATKRNMSLLKVPYNNSQTNNKRIKTEIHTEETMKTTCIQTVFLTILCFLTACNPAKSNQTETSENSRVIKKHQYDSFANAHIVAYQKDGQVYFYNVEADDRVPFTEETEEIFNLKFDPDGHSMYYTVVRDGVLWLRKVVFSDAGVQLEDLLNLNIPKEKCITETYGDNSLMEYQDGKLLIRSDFSWDGYNFGTYNIYTIADNTLTTTSDSEEASKRFGALYQESDDRFETENEHMIYLHNGNRICLTDQLNLKAMGDDYGSTEVDYFKQTVSPDGSKVAFVAINSFGDLAHGPLCIADADGKHQQRLSEDGAAQYFPLQWAGNQLVFANDEESEHENVGIKVLYITDPEENKPIDLIVGVKSFDVKQPVK